MAANVADRRLVGSYLVPVATTLWLLSMLFGIRSGKRGGPLSLQGSEIRMVLLSPYPRERLFRSKLLRTLRHWLFMGLVFGGLVGISIAHLLGSTRGGQGSLAGALYGALVALTYCCSAAVASGAQLSKMVGALVGILILAAAVVAPFDSVHHIAGFLPGGLMLMGDFGATVSGSTTSYAIALALGVVLILSAIFLVPGVDPEMLERRTRLIGLIRYAATFRDFRSVVLIRRALIGDKVHAHRQITKPFEQHLMTRFPAFWRAVVPMLRWNWIRVARVAGLLAITLLSARYAVTTSELFVVPGVVCSWLVGLELTDALGQDADTSEILSLSGTSRGPFQRVLALAPSVVAIVLAIPTLILVLILPDGVRGIGIVGIVLIPILASGLVGAAVSVVREAGSSSQIAFSMSPDTVQIVVLVIELLPLILAGAGFIPVVEAHGKIGSTVNLYSTLISSGTFSLVVPLAGSAWIARRTSAQ